MYRIAIDTGGTFTDCVACDDSGHIYMSKSMTDTENPAVGLINALDELGCICNKNLPELLKETASIAHGTTLVLNALLEKKISRIALLTTEGFRDALEIRRSRLSDQWNLRTPAPDLLVPRNRRIGVRERVDYKGDSLIPLDEEQLETVINRLQKMDIDAVAVCFLFSVINPSHEKQVGEILKKRLPGKYIVLSSDVCPRIREYARTTTTVINACMIKLMNDYLEDLQRKLQENGFEGNIDLMINDGGLTKIGISEDLAVRMLFSGPAGGARGGEHISDILKKDGILVADMGGTSFDVHLINNGMYTVLPETEISGLPLALPVIDIRSVGAGGGSLAKVDAGGNLRVGPESAGSQPGPACYGRGGDQPSLTDAMLVIGLLDENDFCNGRVKLDRSRAEAVLQKHVADILGIDVYDAALAVYKIASAKMADVLRLVTVKEGKDPRDFSLLSAGGAFPLFASEIMRDLQMQETIVPVQSPLFCAWGMLGAPHMHTSSVAVMMKKGVWAAEELLTRIDKLKENSKSSLLDMGVKEEQQLFSINMEMRYTDQHHEIVVGFPSSSEDDLLCAIDKIFHMRHDELYGYATEEKEWEIVNIRVTAEEKLTRNPAMFSERSISGGNICSGTRNVYSLGGWQKYTVFKSIEKKRWHAGPLLIDYPYTTVFVPEGFRVIMHEDGTLIIQDGGAKYHEQ